MPNNLLVTGESGVGKSTALKQATEHIGSRTIAGFLSPRVVDDRSDSGWRIEGFNGVSGLLAHASISGRHRLGLLGVDMELFKRCIAAETAVVGRADTLIIDEIGIIGGWSSEFRRFARRALDSHIPTIAIVRQKSGELSDEVKGRDDIEIMTVDKENRDIVASEIARWIGSFGSSVYES